MRKNGGLIGVENLPTLLVSNGIWDLHQQALSQLGGKWPVFSLLSDGLIGLWEFEDNVNDSAGANNMTVSGTTAYSAAEGNLGKGFAFNGSTDMTKNSPSSLAPTDTITIGVACKIAATASAAYIVDRAGSTEGWLLYITATNSYASISLNGGAAIATGSGAVDTGNLVFLMATYDKSAGGTTELKLYVNDSQVATADYSTAIDYSPDPGINIGGLGGSGRLPNGSIVYQVAVWNKVLTTDERAAWYNSGAGIAIL